MVLKKMDIDSKQYLFSMQTFLNILKILVYSFLAQLVIQCLQHSKS